MSPDVQQKRDVQNLHLARAASASTVGAFNDPSLQREENNTKTALSSKILQNVLSDFCDVLKYF